MASASTGNKASQPEDLPGEAKHSVSSALEASAGYIQKLTPVKQIGQHLCAFHFYHNDLRRQVEAHHYCSHMNEDLHQCVIYDTDKPNARLIGVEYIVTEKVFRTLDEEEKKFWHSHEYEVKSGMLHLPGVPAVAENVVMDKLAKTYGKTWHFWQYDRGDTLPLGVPQLMGAFTRDGQANAELLKDMAKRYSVDIEGNRKAREGISGPEHGISKQANSWESGKAIVLEPKECKFEQ